jgi:hypothetical protein
VKDGVVGNIRAEMKRRFPEATFNVPEQVHDQDTIAFAYLQRTLKVREAFDHLKDPLVFSSKSGPVKVDCFGVRQLNDTLDRGSALGKQVSILSRKSDDDFVLRLNTTSEDDEIILAKVKPEATLAATLAAVRERIKLRRGLDDEAPAQLLTGESLVVPIIDVNVWRTYSELEGRSLTNPKWSKVTLAVAQQGIQFRLDENGAILKSKAHATWTSTRRVEPFSYIFDKPFLLMMKRKSKDQPYFVVWVETPELLVELQNKD